MKSKGFKDFLYDKNDILIAIIILLLAGLLIAWRLDVIMDYPSTLAAETNTTDTTKDTAVPDENGPDTNTDLSTLWQDGVLTTEVQVTIEGGSATGAVQCLIDAGLFTSYDQFVQVCNAAGYAPEDIKATTFTFSPGCTQTDIAQIVTQ